MFTLNCKGRLLVIDKPVVMGILNITPDSFFKTSRTNSDVELLERAEAMLQQGATILDIGGQSTRPNSTRIPADEELRRVIPAIQTVLKKFPDALISIDTYYALVAKEAVAAGAAIVNDVSAGTMDAAMFETVAALKVPYVLTHIQGNLDTMQQNPTYENVVLEVFDFLNFKVKQLEAAGVADVIIDPGFGFGKTIAHNFKLLNELSYLKKMGKPLLIGISRKGTIYKTLDITADEALNGTTVLNTVGLLQGADILRVHDVKEVMQAIRLIAELKK